MKEKYLNIDYLRAFSLPFFRCFHSAEFLDNVHKYGSDSLSVSGTSRQKMRTTPNKLTYLHQLALLVDYFPNLQQLP